MAVAALSDAATVCGTGPEPAHLFVLVHGLWGGPNHMLTIDRCLHLALPEASAEHICTIRPTSFRFWKTYDGLDYNLRRVIAEIFYEMETLLEKNNYKVTKISFVGYSLGGLIARYVVGLLYEMGFFEKVEPVFFTTFATPHVGVEFFKNNFFDRTANRMGPYLFGKSGRQLFVADSEKVLVEMANPKGCFFRGLKLFQVHIALANVFNDRTVAFYTSYIAEYAPFDQWDAVKIKYLKDMPHLRVGRSRVQPKFVDLLRSHLVELPASFKGNVQEETLVFRANPYIRVLVIVVGATILLPTWIPLVLISSLGASIYSMIKVRVISSPDIRAHWKRVEDSVCGTGPVDAQDAQNGQDRREQRRNSMKHETFRGDTSNLTENTMENILYAEERLSGNAGRLEDDEDHEETETGDLQALQPTDEVEDDADEPLVDENATLFAKFKRNPKKKIVEVDYALNDESVAAHLPALRNPDYLKFPLFSEKARLTMRLEKQYIIDQLNTLGWIKIPVLYDLFNSHDGIVARRGERTSPKGTSSIYLWASILRRHMKGEKGDKILAA